jgi:hypothetical protein
MKNIILIALSIALLSGCKSQNLHQTDAKPLNKFTDINKSSYQTTYDASKRGSIVYINYATDGIKLLAEPPADAIVSALSEFTSKLDLKGEVTIDAANSYLESVTKLNSSSVSNTMMRDALYRLNEMQFNGWNFEGNYKDAFEKIMNLIETVAKLELQKVEKENLNSEKEILKLKNPDINIDLVRKTEREGYEAILEDKVPEAIDKFKTVNELFPSYHNAYELTIYLKKLQKENKKIDNDVKKEIVSKYSWGMSSEIKKIFNQ